jgi:hypothetical protein
MGQVTLVKVCLRRCIRVSGKSQGSALWSPMIRIKAPGNLMSKLPTPLSGKVLA